MPVPPPTQSRRLRVHSREPTIAALLSHWLMAHPLAALAGRDFLTTADYSIAELRGLVDLAFELKNERERGQLPGKTIVLLFFNSSLRTRTSFEIAAYQLGAHHVTLNAGADFWDLEEQLGVVMDGTAAEHVRDAARVLSRYADAVAVRVYPEFADLEHDDREDVLSAFVVDATVPVINMESARAHPCQALGDLMTLSECFASQGDGTLNGRRVTLAWVPHVEPLPHSVPLSMLDVLARAGCRVTIAHPPGFALAPDVIESASAEAAKAGGEVVATTDRAAAFDGAEVVYARSWCSRELYGKWDAEQEHMAALGDAWTITEADMARTAGSGRGRFMHALPVRRNLHATDAVVDAPTALIYQQAENRLHATKALLCALLDGS